MIPITILWAFVMGGRGLNVGADTANYHDLYNIIATNVFNIYELNEKTSFEYGFIIYCKLCSLISSNYLFFQFVTAFIICGGLTKFILDNCRATSITPFIILYAVIYLHGFNITRQILAVIFIINAWTYFSRKQFLKSIILIGLAISSHLSALFAIPIFIIWYIRKWDTIIKILPVFLIWVYFVFDNLIPDFRELTIYAKYMNNDLTHQEVGHVIILWSLIAFIALLTIYSRHASQSDKVFAIFSLLYILFNLLGVQFNYFERLGDYYYPFIALMLPSHASRYRSVLAKNFYLLGMSAFYCLYFLLATTTDQYHYTFY